MNFNRMFLYVEILIIFIHWYLILFSIIIQPIILIFGIICILFLPGYNFLALIRPKSRIIEKLGYSTILSLAIINIFMFLSYLLLYDFFSGGNIGFKFEGIFLISSIQIINLVLISTLLFISKYNIGKNENYNFRIRFILNKIREKMNLKILFIFSIFLISLFFMCLSAFYSYLPNNDYSQNYRDYQDNFTFFRRVPFQFYIFLVISIFSLTSLIFLSKNKYLILISIFLFLYTLWILPYLQIENFFASDSHLNSKVLDGYLKRGIKANSDYNFIYTTYDPDKEYHYRYTTEIFTIIFLMESTKMDINFVMWFIFPLIYFSLPLFFYSLFEKYLKGNNKQNVNLIIITIIVLFIGQFAKSARNATGKPLSTFIFFILIVEFYDFNLINKFKSKIKNGIIIFLLFFLLSLTHFEESIYFLILIIIYNFYFLFFGVRNLRQNNKFSFTRKKLKCYLLTNGILLYILTILWYFIQEFFAQISYYLSGFIISFPLLSSLDEVYLNTMNITLPLLKGGYSINLLVVGALTFSVIFYVIGCYLFIFKFYNLVNYFFRLIFSFLKRIHNIIQSFFNKKYLKYAIIPIFFIAIPIIHHFYFQFLLERDFFLIIIELILNYTIVIFNLFLFFYGICYYERDNIKQNYYILSILASASIMLALFLAGEVQATFYLLNSRFLSFFIVFNLIIIQNTYFKDFIEKKKKYLIIFIIIFLFLGTFYSLRKLASG